MTLPPLPEPRWMESFLIPRSTYKHPRTKGSWWLDVSRESFTARCAKELQVEQTNVSRRHLMFTKKPDSKPTAAEKSAEAHAITEGQPRPAVDDNKGVKASATCKACGYQLHGKEEKHCDACHRDYTVGKGDPCPNDNCSGVLV